MNINDVINVNEERGNSQVKRGVLRLDFLPEPTETFLRILLKLDFYTIFSLLVKIFIKRLLGIFTAFYVSTFP